MLRFFTFVLIFSFNASCLYAQSSSAKRIPTSLQMNIGTMYGKIIDAGTLKPVEGASVQLLQSKADTITKKKKDVIISLIITDKKGEFNIEALPVASSFKIMVSAVGFTTYESKVGFDVRPGAARPGDMSSMNSSVKDLGNIKLSPDEKQLENITITATKPLLEMYLDKKVYNVEKDISVTGGTAVDVMKNVPSVNVDIDGNVTLRNASPQIFIDGRPSSLTLDQIPADQIASVEIITNPSAKYDASGGGSGILNIVLKKNRKAGYNGNVRTSIDSRGRPGFGGDINVKQNKINFFAAGQITSRKNISTVSSKREDFLGNGRANIFQTNNPVNKGYFAFARAGIDYLVTNRTTLTLSASKVRGDFNIADQLNVSKDTVRSSGNVSESAIRALNADLTFKNTGASFGFKHNFARAGRELTADVNFNESDSKNTSNYTNDFFDGSGNPKPPSSAEIATGGALTKYYTAQTDYVYPLSATKKIETGLRIAARDYESWNDNYIQNNVTREYILIPEIGVQYNFRDIVYAGYGTFSQQIKTLSYQLGLRVESSSYKGNLINKNQKFENEFPLSLFPSLFISQKINKTQDIQFNYSRKINRPGFFQILPFVDFSDSLNLSIGNPDLLPEFTHLVEISYANQYKPGNSFLTSLYAKNTNNLITRYQYKAPNTDPAKPDSVIYNSFANANSSYTIGLEITGKNKITRWWDITSNLNLFDVTLKAANISGVGDNSRFSWFAKLNNSFKLPKNYSLQLTGDYQASTLLPVNSGRGAPGGMYGGGMGGQTQNIAQGYILPVYGADISIKKDFLKNNAASLTLQFNDIFRTRTYETHAETAFFIQDNYRQRDPQVLRLNFNWRFGKFDVALLKRKNMKSESEGIPGMGQ
jgi:outer membrane receptor protein involved in Fe transport